MNYHDVSFKVVTNISLDYQNLTSTGSISLDYHSFTSIHQVSLSIVLLAQDPLVSSTFLKAQIPSV